MFTTDLNPILARETEISVRSRTSLARPFKLRAPLTVTVADFKVRDVLYVYVLHSVKHHHVRASHSDRVRVFAPFGPT